MMEAPTEYIVTTMGAIDGGCQELRRLARRHYDSVYYYAEEMKMAQGLKLPEARGRGAEPRDHPFETYPLVNPKYVVIPAGEPKGAPNKVLFARPFERGMDRRSSPRRAMSPSLMWDIPKDRAADRCAPERGLHGRAEGVG